jgi:prepilin-type N-terminal cleavage/methylation domain-containing protein
MLPMANPEEKEKIKTSIIGKSNNRKMRKLKDLSLRFVTKISRVARNDMKVNGDTISQAGLHFRDRNFTNHGFTLIELMLVVALIGLFLVVAVPAMRDTFTSDPLKKASRQLIGLERKLRTDAVRDQTDYILNLDLSKASFWVTTPSMTPEKIDDIKKNPQHLSGGVTISDIVTEGDKKQSATVVVMKFSKKNACPPAVIHLAYDEKAMTLAINPFLGVTDVYDKYVDIVLEKAENSIFR